VEQNEELDRPMKNAWLLVTSRKSLFLGVLILHILVEEVGTTDDLDEVTSVLVAAEDDLVSCKSPLDCQSTCCSRAEL